MLKPVLTLENQSWINEPAAQRIMKVLNDAHESDGLAACFVGGCVRNAILNHPIKDIDICTIHKPDTVLKIMQDNDIKAIPTGIDHGTVTAVIDEHVFEITSLRKDIKTDGRHAEVTFTDNWMEDALRRDFTMNTLLADEKGQVYDPTGEGVDHAKNGRVIFVGRAESRIKEDYLRILRFFRFHAYYGQGEPNAHALKACKGLANNIWDLSKERITSEFLKILQSKNILFVLYIIFKNNILSKFSYAEYKESVLSNCIKNEDYLNIKHPLNRLLALTGLNEENLHDCLTYLRLSNNQKRYLEHTLAACKAYEMSLHSLKTVAYFSGIDVMKGFYCLVGSGDKEQLSFIKSPEIPVFPLKAKDLIEKGFEPGPKLGERLKELENQWIESDFDNNFSY